MKTSKWFKVLICMIMSCALYAFTLPSYEANAASSTQAKVTTKTYKDQKFLKYPQVSGLKSTSAQKKMNNVLSKHIQGSYKGYLQLKKDMEEYKKEADCKEMPSSCEYEYNTSYKVKYNRDGKLSILLLDYMYSGGAHGLGTVTTYNFNVKTGKQYKMSDILTSKSKYTNVTNYVKKYMIKHSDLFFADDDTFKNFKVNTTNQFYFTDKGIYLIFQEYEVAPYAAGNPVIKVPSFVYK